MLAGLPFIGGFASSQLIRKPSGGSHSLNISVFMMQPEEVGIVGRRVKEVLEEALELGTPQ